MGRPRPTAEDLFVANVSELDPYDSNDTSSSSSSPPPLTQYTPGLLPSHIPTDTLWRIPWYNRNWLFPNASSERVLVDYLSKTEKQLARPLTAEEQTAIAQNASTGLYLSSYGSLATLVWTARRLQVTRSTLNIPPFGKMVRGDGAEPRKFLPFWDGFTLRAFGYRDMFRFLPLPNRMIYLNVLRAVSYYMIGNIMFWQPIFTMLGSNKCLSSNAADTRLEDFTRDRLRLSKDKAAAQRRVDMWRKNHGMKPLPTEPALNGDAEPREEEDAMTRKRDPMGQGQQEAGNIWGNHRRAIERPGNSIQESIDSGPDYQTGLDMSDITDDSTPTPRQERQETQPSRAPEAPIEEAEQLQKRRARRRRHAGSKPEHAEGTDGMTDASDPAGDAWERLRSGQNDRRAQDSENQGQGDNFTISRDEEEKSYAREEAQKRFDERVERERRGENFDSSD